MNVYDFDNTIYDGESCFDLFKFYLKKDPSLLKSFPTVVKGFARYKKGKISLDEMISKYVPLVEEKLAKIDFEHKLNQNYRLNLHGICRKNLSIYYRKSYHWIYQMTIL